jgi:predicted nucleotidyltransferase
MTELSDAIRNIAGLLESMGTSYAIMGGIAVRAYGIPRATYDVDFTAALDPITLAKFFSGASALGYSVPDPYLQGWLDEVGGMRLVKVRLYLGGRGIDVDIFLAETPFQQEILRRRRRVQLNGLESWLVSPEDLILLKLLANRPRDIADVGDVIFMQGQLDLSYIQHWASQLNLTDRLSAVLSEHYPNP